MPARLPLLHRVPGSVEAGRASRERRRSGAGGGWQHRPGSARAARGDFPPTRIQSGAGFLLESAGQDAPGSRRRRPPAGLASFAGFRGAPPEIGRVPEKPGQVSESAGESGATHFAQRLQIRRPRPVHSRLQDSASRPVGSDRQPAVSGREPAVSSRAAAPASK